MKTGLITVAALVSVMALSGAAMAGGENCASKKGAHKDMSAASGHSWDKHASVLPQSSAQDAATTAPSAATDANVVQDVPAKPSKSALNI